MESLRSRFWVELQVAWRGVPQTKPPSSEEALVETPASVLSGIEGWEEDDEDEDALEEDVRSEELLGNKLDVSIENEQDASTSPMMDKANGAFVFFMICSS